MSRIQIFNNSGFKLEELDTDADRSWLIGQYGRAKFTIPVISDKCRDHILRFGNFVLIEHEKLHSWGGVIDTPRSWGNNKVEVNAYSAEYLLKYRIVGYGDKNITAGAMFKECIDIANRVSDTRLIKAGPIDEGGTAIKFELRNEEIYEFAKKKITDAGYEWRITPALENNRLAFEATLYQEYKVITDMILAEGLNIEANDNVLTEDGDIFNQYLGFGKGTSWSGRYKYNTADLDSQSKYGYRETAYEVNDSNKANVEKYTDEELNRTKEPLRKFDLSAMDKGDTWKYLNLGAIMKVQLSVCGFNGDKLGTDADVRIIGMAYEESRGVVRLICEEHDDSTE